MDKQQGQQAHGEETKSSTAAVRHSRPEQIRYLPMPTGPTVVNFPPHFTDVLSENRFAQAVTVDQQRELTQYVRGLNGRVEREFEERHDDLRRLRTAFEQMGRDVRDFKDDESTSSTSDTVAIPPQQVPELPANQPYSTVQLPPAVPNQRERHPINPQPRPIVVMIPTTYAPRPIPAVPWRFRPRHLLPPAQQPANRVSPEPPIFIPPDSSGSGGRSSTPTPTPGPSGLGDMDPKVTIIPASSSSSPSYDIPEIHNGGIHRRRINQPLPVHPRPSMGSDVIVVPLSSASTPSSPARGMSRRPSVTSLRGRGVLRRTPSARSERSRTPLVVTNPPSPVPTGHTLPGPVLRTPTLRPAASQPIAVMQQSPQPRPMIQRFPSPLSAAVTSTSPEQIHGAEFPILRPPPGLTPVPVTISSPVSPVFSREVTPHSPEIIWQHSPVSMPRRVQTPFQPAVMRTSPTRLSKRHRPQPTHVDPVPVILPQPARRIPPPPQPEVILMPARTDSRGHRQSHRQLRPIDTSVAFPTPAVTAMNYPETVGSRVRTTAQPSASFIIPVSSSDDFRSSLQAAERPVIIRRSPSRVSSRRRSFTTPFTPQPRPISSNSSFRSSMHAAERPVAIRRSPSRSPSPRRAQTNTATPTQRSRLTKRRRPQPTPADPLPSQPIGRPPRQPEIVLMPARTESTRNRQNRRQLRPIDTSVAVPRPVTAMTYPETVSHARTTARISTAPFITPQPSPTSSNSSLSIRRSHSSSRHRIPSHTTTPTQPSRLTKRVPPPVQPEVVLMPARTESMRYRQSRRQLRPIDTPVVLPTPAAVTALTYPETVGHGRTTAQYQQPRPMSSNSSFRSSMHTAEQTVVIRGSPSRSPSRRASPDTATHTQPSRLMKRRRPQPTSANPIPPPPQPEIVVVPARTESMRSRQNHHQLRPIDASTNIPTTRAVTAMTYPETVSRVRTTAQAPTIVPLGSPTTSNNSFRASMQPAKHPVVIPSHPSFRRAQHNTTARPDIVVLPPRSSHSTDSSPIVVSTSLAADPSHHQISPDGALLDSSQPQSGAGAVVVPLDSDAEELRMGLRPPVSRRPSFSGRDMVSYDSRSRAYSSDDDSASPPACITPTSFRGRTRSPHVRTPTSRQSQSPPRIYRQPDSTDLWDPQKSRTHAQQGWYRRRSSGTESISPPAANPLRQQRADRGPRHKASGPITNTFSIHGEIRTRGSQRPGVGLGEVIARGVVRGGLERPRERSGNVLLAPDSRPKRTKSSWSGWLAGL